MEARYVFEHNIMIHQIKLSEDHTWTRREKSDKGEELGSVIERGLHKPALATDVVKVVLQELVREKAR